LNPFQVLIFIETLKKTAVLNAFGKGPSDKYRMRPICQACHQRPCAVNYIREDITHYRSRCETCARKGRGLKPREPRWKSAGYKKKMSCDRCGFKAKYAGQIFVYHVDGNLNNAGLKNLKSVCRNCEVELSKSDLAWRQGDLEPDT
jgi:hypothetical protein